MLQAADRAASLGLTPTRLNDSYGLNQSFPRSQVTSQQMARRLESPCLLGGRRLVSPYMVTTARSTDCLANSSLLAQGTRAGSRLMQNPNKAWAIISESGSILVNNSILSSLLGYSDTDLRQLQLWDLIIKRSGDKRQEALEQLDIEAGSGETSAYNGRVVSIRCSDQSQVTVSINVRKLPDSTRYMVYIEPVSRTVGFIDVNRDGVVTDVDSDCEAIFQCRGSDVVGVHLESLVTSVQWLQVSLQY